MAAFGTVIIMIKDDIMRYFDKVLTLHTNSQNPTVLDRST